MGAPSPRRCAERGRRGRTRAGGLAALGVAAALVASCAGGGDGTGGGAGLGPTSFVGEDGGSPAPALSNGQTVTLLETKLPYLDEFTLRATVPVIPKTYPRADGLEPFTVLDYDGTPLVTQTNPVAFFANDADGASVVEVVARVRKDPALTYGAFTTYRLVMDPHPAAASTPSRTLADLRAPGGLAPAVLGLLSDPNAIEISAYDVFGNRYVCRPLDGSGWLRVERYGDVESELRVFQHMMPEPAVGGATGTLPHLFGVHAYLRTFGVAEMFEIDLRFNNGDTGNDTGDPRDDPLGKVYFERIDLTVPSTWYVEQGFEDPFFGQEVVGSGRRTISIVNPNPDGSMHVIDWQGQMHRRIMIGTSFSRNEARQTIQEGAGLGFCSRGTDPGDGHEYWSWWNRGTSHYFPQNYQLPDLRHVGIWNLRGQEQGKFDALRGYLENGNGTGNYPVQSGNLGWAHPYGVTYGGMTGGDEIFCYDGVTTANAASRLGILAYRATHRMHTERMPTAFYDLDGEPSSVEDWLVGGIYVPFEYFVHPDLKTGDPFGVGSAPTFQVQAVQNQGKVPSYESALFRFEAHDYQHYIRYTRSAKVLAWLSNDSIAKDDLRMQAENFRLAYHPYDNGVSGHVQGTGMKADQQFVATNPSKGFTFGRGEAWGSDCSVAAYALSDQAWRSARIDWFRQLATLVSDGQGSCNGFIQATISPKMLNGQFRARQQIEQSITENMLQGLRESVFRGADNAYSDLVRDVLGDSLRGFISDMVFMPGESAPRSIGGVGPLDPNQGIWCSFKQMTNGAWSQYKETYQDWSSFAWGYELTGDQEFLDKALGQTGSGGSLLNAMQSQGTSNIENRSALLALVQRLNGTL